MKKRSYNKLYYKNEEEWLELRKSGVGGSDIGGLLGYYKTAVDIYREKVYGYRQDETEKMRFGKLFEPVIAQEFANRYGYKLTKPKYIMQSKEYPFLIASVDYIISKDGEDGILECKTTSSYVYKTWLTGLPPAYYLQLQHYLLVSGFNYGYIAIAINGQKLEAIRFERDVETIEIIIKEAQKFWYEHIIPKIEPEPKEAVEHIPEGTLEADIKILELYNDICDLEAQRKAIDDKLELLKKELITIIGDKETITRDNIPIIQHKVITKNVLDTKRFASELPQIYQNYLKKVTYKQLRIIKEEQEV